MTYEYGGGFFFSFFFSSSQPNRVEYLHRTTLWFCILASFTATVGYGIIPTAANTLVANFCTYLQVGIFTKVG
jgi:hypothetical protein